MFCVNCGVQIPDGAKFCTNCGAAQTPAENAPSYEPASSMMPEVPAVPDPVAPAAPYFPDPTPDPAAEAPAEPASAEPFAAFDAAAQDSPYVDPAPAAEPAVNPAPAAAYANPRPSFTAQPEAQPQNVGGWSIPGDGRSVPSGYTVPAAAPAAATGKKSKAGLWITLGVIVLVVLAIFLLVFGLIRNLGAKTGGTPASSGTGITRPDLSARTGDDGQVVDGDMSDILSGAYGDVPESADSGERTFEECVAYFEEEFQDTFGGDDAIGWVFTVDDTYGDEGEGWVDAYLWEDGMLDWALDAYSGNEESLESWQETLDSLCYLSSEMQGYLVDHGREGSVICLNLVEQEQYEYLLSFVVDGEVIYDEVTGVDLWDLASE